MTNQNEIRYINNVYMCTTSYISLDNLFILLLLISQIQLLIPCCLSILFFYSCHLPNLKTNKKQQQQYPHVFNQYIIHMIPISSYPKRHWKETSVCTLSQHNLTFLTFNHITTTNTTVCLFVSTHTTTSVGWICFVTT